MGEAVKNFWEQLRNRPPKASKLYIVECSLPDRISLHYGNTTITGDDFSNIIPGKTITLNKADEGNIKKLIDIGVIIRIEEINNE